MSRVKLLSWVVVAAAVTWALPFAARASDDPNGVQPDSYKVQYYDTRAPVGGTLTPAVGDNTIHAVNPEDYNICAQYYVFDNTQEMQECCSCLITHNGFEVVSTKLNLTSNPSHGGRPTKGVIEIVTTLPNNSGLCAVTQGDNVSFEANIAPTVRAWIGHNVIQVTAPNFSEEEFEDVALSETQEDALEVACAALTSSGFGTCSCGTTN
jgi:hypothetical protein